MRTVADARLSVRTSLNSDLIESPAAMSLATTEPLLPDRHPICRGKVREMYEVQPDEMELYDAGEDRLLMVATDHISTFDCVHETDIPDKGKVLTALSVFWFEQTRDIGPNHLISETKVPVEVVGRTLLIERLEMFAVECVVRGYLAGSAWSDYRKTGGVSGVELPTGLEEGSRLPAPIFTPATKAETGSHDENIDMDSAASLVGGRAVMEELSRLSIALYSFAADYALERGIILADTKFEFGRKRDRRIALADEVLTPDSSRFWPADDYRPGRPQPSFDKQFVRDWATSTDWDKTFPGPALPDEVVEGTRARYIEAYERITERSFSDWLALRSSLA
jgi:phosphoribosylaminoimidazole-succinocarboxamide synthase